MEDFYYMSFVIRNNFEIVEYVEIVNAIVAEFFNDEGDYTPHIGKLNAMRVFYNDCVKESKFDLSHDISEALELTPLVEDDEFIQEYNKALKGDGTVRLDFANAYADAMQIVNTRKDSINGGVDRLKFALEEIINKIFRLVTKFIV